MGESFDLLLLAAVIKTLDLSLTLTVRQNKITLLLSLT